MNNKRPISLTICCILAIITGSSVFTFAGNKSSTNAQAEQHLEKANELRKLADHKGAIVEYEKVISLLPKSEIAQNAQYWIGQIYFEARQFDSALSTFQKLVDEFSSSAVVPRTRVMIERVQQAKKNKALFEAVKKADVEQVKHLITQGAEVDARWGDLYSKNEETLRPKDSDRTALRRAVKTGNMEVVKLLVEAGANVNAGEWPPLLQAVEENNTAIAEYLIDHGANVNPRGDKDPWDWGPLQYASGLKINNIEMVKLLVAKGADISVGGSITALQMAIFTGRRDVFNLLIQHGADVNAEDYQGGYTPLYFAIHEDDSYYMNTLIAKGADVNSKYRGGETLLGSAAITGRTESVKVLLEAGADVNAKDDNGQTALHLPLDIRNSNWKKYKLSKDTIMSLLNNGADVNLKDNNGRTPLHLAAETADADIIKLLLDKGAEINAKDDKSGYTVLHHAARLGKIDIAELLIARGADINAKDKDGHTPLDVAVNHDYKMAELLISKGADSTIKTESGKTLIQLAQERNKRESTAPDMIFDGDPNSLFGSRIACGDIDGDGYADILIDARKYDDFRGRVCLYYGGPGMDNKPDLILEGQNKGDLLGDGIACGDIDNDGYDDIVMSAGGYNEKRGCAYLYWGKERKSMDANSDETFIQEVEKGAWFSMGYPAIYDIDNDGYRDIILGACAHWSPGNGKGRAYLYYGNKKELMDTSADLIFTEENRRDQFGLRIACGDVDNDGFGDIIIRTIDQPRLKQQDRTYIYFGSSKSNMDAKVDITIEAMFEVFNYIGSIICIDQNGDGYDDLVIGDPGYNNKQGSVYIFHGNSKRNPDTEPAVTFEGQAEQSDYGIQMVCGDFDGDDLNDIAIGTRGSKQAVGRVYVYLGKELYSANPKPQRILIGENPDDGFGFGLACGDVNNDGFDDLVVGALKAEANQGRAYLYYGGPEK